ncbi:hypothetical protein HOD08_01275 [bacterium]|jgi:hypothetical protein|nr:hypothetical protein [bacterium]
MFCKSIFAAVVMFSTAAFGGEIDDQYCPIPINCYDTGVFPGRSCSGSEFGKIMRSGGLNSLQFCFWISGLDSQSKKESLINNSHKFPHRRLDAVAMIFDPETSPELFLGECGDSSFEYLDFSDLLIKFPAIKTIYFHDCHRDYLRRAAVPGWIYNDELCAFVFKGK